MAYLFQQVPGCTGDPTVKRLLSNNGHLYNDHSLQRPPPYNDYLSTTTTSLKRPGFFVPTQTLNFTLFIEIYLQPPPLYKLRPGCFVPTVHRSKHLTLIETVLCTIQQPTTLRRPANSILPQSGRSREVQLCKLNFKSSLRIMAQSNFQRTSTDFSLMKG